MREKSEVLLARDRNWLLFVHCVLCLAVFSLIVAVNLLDIEDS